ncbi:MAG: hypothetical protein KDJ52_22085 [Anaerolineae bacterium]|nr:hypothetical protein [Anaerolineae bacterium]
MTEITEFNEQNSFIVDMDFIDDNTVAVEACVDRDSVYVDEEGQALPDAYQPDSGLMPYALTLERGDLWWLITELDDADLTCEVDE